MIITTGCKINFGLKILDKREDGYHNLKTVFYPLSEPYDELHIEKTQGHSINVTCSINDIDKQNNTLTKAFHLYAQKITPSFGLNVYLKKGVPHGAGLGGGSANAAAMLEFLQKSTKNPLTKAELLNIAAKIGADVPFFLYNTPCNAEGIGEILTPSKLDLSSYYLLLIMPNIKISTAWAFKKLSEEKKLLTSKTEKDNKCRSIFLEREIAENDFEHIVFKEYSELLTAKETLLQEKAIFASLSGTGSALYGLFETITDRDKAIQKLSEKHFFKMWKYCCPKMQAY